MPHPTIMVLGIGNILLRDEGIGVHVVEQLLEQVALPDISFIDGGTTPDIVSLVGDGIAKLIIIDAALAGGEPGDVYRFDSADLEPGAGQAVSLHEFGIVDNIRLMSLLGNKPRSVVIYGVEPKDMESGLELSPELQNKIPRIMELILKEIAVTNTSMEVDR